MAVSLVRNNTKPKEEGLGFLDRPRMNVLLSRAERLLVLLGSWDFFVDQVSLIDRDDASHKLLHWDRSSICSKAGSRPAGQRESTRSPRDSSASATAHCSSHRRVHRCLRGAL
ncbi:MAG: hypothetical protein ACRDYY_16635 [Acidimicrobiales bacterium]